LRGCGSGAEGGKEEQDWERGNGVSHDGWEFTTGDLGRDGGGIGCSDLGCWFHCGLWAMGWGGLRIAGEGDGDLVSGNGRIVCGSCV
jgi:hypothetical protein